MSWLIQKFQSKNGNVLTPHIVSTTDQMGLWEFWIFDLQLVCLQTSSSYLRWHCVLMPKTPHQDIQLPAECRRRATDHMLGQVPLSHRQRHQRYHLGPVKVELNDVWCQWKDICILYGPKSFVAKNCKCQTIDDNLNIDDLVRPVLQKNANGNRNPCKATLRKSSSGTASRSAWVAKSSSLEACYMTSQAWLFQKPWHFSWKKTNLVNCNQGWLHREFISHSIGFLEFFEILPLHPLPPSLQSQSSGIRKTIAIHPLAQILFINPGIAISS